MRKFWIYVHVSVALITWLFILLTLSLSLVNASEGIHQDPGLMAIVILLTLGHLSGGNYLAQGIHRAIRKTRDAGVESRDGKRTKSPMQTSS